MPADVSIKALAERVRGLARLAQAARPPLRRASLSVLAMAPFFAWPVLWLTLPALVWLIDGALSPQASAPRSGRRRSAHPAGTVVPGCARMTWSPPAVGWWFGFGYFLAGLFWIGEAFLVEAEIFAVPAAVRGHAAAGGPRAVLCGGDGARRALLARRAGRVLVLALALSATEWLRGHVLTGFPWNVLGYALTYPLPLMQSAGRGRHLRADAAARCSSSRCRPCCGARRRRRGRPARTTRGARDRRAAARCSLAAARPDAGWRWRPQAIVPGVKIRIVQPSVPQREKWRPENQRRIFLDHLDAVGRPMPPARSTISPASRT